MWNCDPSHCDSPTSCAICFWHCTNMFETAVGIGAISRLVSHANGKDVPCIWIEETHFGFPLPEPFFGLDLPRPLPLVLDPVGVSEI